MRSDLPETILQFGAGRFLRGFVDMFVHQANMAGHNVGRVVVAQSTGGDRAQLLNAGGGRFHVLVRGFEAGREIDECIQVESVSRALVVSEDWPELVAVAASPDLKWIVSNTTEAGLALDPADASPSDSAPRSYPARLLALLAARHRAGAPPVTILPCELVVRNADRLRTLVREQGEMWNCDPATLQWVENACEWHNTLVDRIVTERPAGHPRLDSDRLVTVVEPFAFWAIDGCEGTGSLFSHPAIARAADITPYALRKVRILNGAHTALVGRALPLGFVTVREAVSDPAIAEWLERLLFTEIVPTMEGRAPGAEEFARHTLERFRNPFVEHNLKDIALYHEQKVRIRLMPTAEEYMQRFGRTPPLLSAALQGQGK